MNSSPFSVVSRLPGCGSPCSNCSVPRSPTLAQPSQRVAQQLAVPLGERRRADAVRHELVGRVDAIGEVRRRDIERAHSGVQPLERDRVVGWRDPPRRRFVVAPQRDHEAITLVDAGLHPRLKSRHRAPGFREPLSKLDFELLRPDVATGATWARTSHGSSRSVSLFEF